MEVSSLEWLNEPKNVGTNNLAGICVIVLCTGANSSCMTYCSRYREPCPRKAFQLQESK